MRKKYTPVFKIFSVAAIGFLMLCLQSPLVYGQMVQVSEGFNQAGPYPALNVPLGWNTGKIVGSDPENYWDRVSIGAHPIGVPSRSAPSMLRYYSWATVSGEQAFVMSKPFDLSNRGGVSSNFRFWMYRDPEYAIIGAGPVSSNITMGTNTIVVASNAGIAIGQTAIGTNIGANAVVTGIAGTTITLSVNSTGTNNNVVTFYNPTSDRIQVYVNDSAVLSGGATLLSDTAFGASTLYRNAYLFPQATGLTYGWNQYGYTIPAGAAWNTAKIFVIIVATSNFQNDIFIDDFSIDTWPKNMSYISCDLVAQNTINVGQNTNNNWIVRGRIICDGAGSPFNVQSFTFNRNGSTNPCIDITATGAKLWFTGGSKDLDLSIAQQLGSAQSACPTNIVFSGLTQTLENDTNYFWLTYDIAAGAVGGNCVDAEWVDVTMNGGVGLKTPGIQTLAGCREIDLAYCIPTMFVGTSWLNGSYTNNDYIQCVQLNGAFGFPSINNCLNSAGPNQPPWNGGPAPFSAHPPDYERFAPTAGRTTVLKVDSTYTILAQVGTWSSGNYLAAWIDYNHDGDFFDVVGGQNEKIMQSPGLSSNSWSSAGVGTFTVPNGSFIGSTTLRVREVWAVGNIGPCNTYTYGETEDYTITILPDCNILPGWRVWLGGFSDDWNNSFNWCGGVPTIGTDAAIIPDIDPVAVGVQAPTYQPTIKSGVAATTRKLRIDGNSTVTINAQTGASLITGDSLDIRTASSTFAVIDGLRSQAEISNGTLLGPNSNLFNGGNFFRRQRSQILYGQAEFLARGVIANDIIDTISLYISTRNSTVPYENFTISYYYTNANYSFPLTPTVWAPVVVTGGTIFGPQSLNLATVPAGGGWVHFPVTMVWSGAALDVVIEMCWDNSATANNLSDNNFTTQTLGVRKFASGRSSAGAPAPCTMLPTAFMVKNGNDLRPNLTFKYRREYDKVPIEVRGHWNNNGTFISGTKSIVKFAGTNQQHLGGASNSTFHELQIINPNYVLQNTSATVDDTLWLTSGRFVLNGDGIGIKTLTLNNGGLGAITRTANGYLQSETGAPDYGLLHWKIGANNLSYSIPFINAAGVYIPFVYNITAGTSDLTVGTYGTVPNNSPWPTGVTNINGYYAPFNAGPNFNGPNMVDRFWIINEAGSGVGADLTFNFSSAEASGVSSPYESQRWDGTIWQLPTPGQSFTATSNASPGITALNTPWVVVGNVIPLPIELLSFDARPDNQRVRIEWTTATEIDNDYFEVDRTTGKDEYSFIDMVKSYGPSTENRKYTTFDERPVQGVQYYRLKQVDYDGAFRYYGPVAVNFGKQSVFDIVTVVPNDQSNYTVVFKYDSDEPYNLRIVDAMGRVVVSADGLRATEGINNLEIDFDLAAGVYTLFLQNSSKMVSKKFFN